MNSYKAALPLILLLVLSACFGPRTYVLRHEQVQENEYVRFQPPNGDWETFWNPLFTDSSKHKEVKAQEAMFHKYVKGATYDMWIQTYPFEWMPIDILFDKDGDFEARSKYLSNTPATLARNKEQGISYDKDWTTYVQGLKCLGSVFSRSHGGVLKSLASKNYSITCGYYDKNEGRRILRIAYTYRHAGGMLRHQKDKGVPEEQLITVEQAEAWLKNAVREVVASIRIKNLDRERMQAEGLLHPNKAFKSGPY